MQPFPSQMIRNVALVGHQGAGKTTLAEALLHVSGTISRRGRVEDGSTTCDWSPEEQKRHTTLSLALAPLVWQQHKINLIDTPGYAEFGGEVDAALGVADLAVFVVSAVEGPEIGTVSIWERAAQIGIPRMIFVNKLDRDRASFEDCVESLRSAFGPGIAPIELPLSTEGPGLTIVDLLRDEAFTYTDGKAVPCSIPEAEALHEHEVHDQLVEGIVVGDDEVLERYLDGIAPTFEQLEGTLAKGVLAASVFPVVCGSAFEEIGVDRLADFICELGPSPLDRPRTRIRAGEDVLEIPPQPDSEPLAHVFKTISDPYVGRISLLKVDAGSLRMDDHLINSRTGDEERLHGLVTVRGREHEPADQVSMGDIAAVTKLASTSTGDTLASKGKPVEVIHTPPLEPVYAAAVVPTSQADDDKLATALHRIVEEDPSLRVTTDPETRQTLLEGAGETHVAVAVERMARRFGVEVTIEPVRVPYHETVTTNASAEGRYKKQTGGHGQFAVVTLRIEPLEAGAGFRFVDEVVGGAIPRQFISSVQRGVEEAMAEGGVLGYPVVDVLVAVTDGKHHPVDSSEMAFRAAARLAFRTAEQAAAPVLLEPVSRLTVTVPVDLQGDVLGDLNARRGRVVSTNSSASGSCELAAVVPRAELQRYATELRSITGGRGAFTATHDRYDVVPANIASRLAAPADHGR